MKVIGHQHVSMQRTVKSLGEFSEMIQEETIVLRGKETGLPVVSALDDVYGQSSGLKGGLRGMASPILLNNYLF
jgi:hypothetical protein